MVKSSFTAQKSSCFVFLAILWCMGHESMLEDEADANDEDASDHESMKSGGEDEELPPIEFAGLQLKSTKDSMTVELFKKIQKLKGYNSFCYEINFDFPLHTATCG